MDYLELSVDPRSGLFSLYFLFCYFGWFRKRCTPRCMVLAWLLYYNSSAKPFSEYSFTFLLFNIFLSSTSKKKKKKVNVILVFIF